MKKLRKKQALIIRLQKLFSIIPLWLIQIIIFIAVLILGSLILVLGSLILVKLQDPKYNQTETPNYAPFGAAVDIHYDTFNQ